MPSPTPLKALMARKIATPGRMTSSFAPGSSTSWNPSAMSKPHDAVGSGAPKPRKLSALSSRIAEPMPKVAATSAGERQFGITWTNSVRKGGLPAARLASTNGSSRRRRASARTSREVSAQRVRPITAMVLARVVRSRMPWTASSSSKRGKLSSTSAVRVTTASTAPPR